MRVYYLLFYVYCVANSDEKETKRQAEIRKTLEQFSKNHTVLIDGYSLVMRHVATNVLIYRNYHSMDTVIPYSIDRDVSEARFTFQSEEIHMNKIGSCDPEDIIINLKRASYPAVNPDNYDFPKDFISPASREPIHTVEIKSNGLYRHYFIKNPKPGNWYAYIYIKWEDPRSQKVEQEGLVADCRTVVYTDLQVKREEKIKLIDCYTRLSVDNADIPANFKCMALDSTDPISFNFTINSTTNSGTILLRIQAQSLPTEKEYLVTCVFDPKLNNVQTVTFSPNPNVWHYIQLDHITNGSKYADCESYYGTDLEESDSNHTVVDLMRHLKDWPFSFEYGLPTTDNQDAVSLINLTSSEIKTVRFPMHNHVDIGGNLVIEASLLMGLKYYMGYKRELKKGALLGFTEENQFYKVVICMDIDYASIPLKTGHCKFNDHVKPALYVLNSTDSESIYRKTIIPYPDAGTWYLTFRLFCDEVVCPCRTSHDGTRYYVDSEGSHKDEGENISGEIANYTREGEKNCNATVVLSITSATCINGECSNHGVCKLKIVGSLMMTFCHCTAGYGGWDCSDDSRMVNRSYMLKAVLFLTLSNLLFIVTIYVAVIRLYYTEAVMYAFTMVFSTFYHACDSPAQVAYCIVQRNVLQFGDFYCGIMCFWVTLLAMSTITGKFRSFLQLVGAIVIALLTTWNMHSIISFIVPVIIGIVILLFSWFWEYNKKRRLSYPKAYYIKLMPVGLVLVSIGLICYAFLQTEKNYKIVHSVWHAIIALSVAFLLPDVKRDGDFNPFLPKPNFFKFSFSRVFNRSQAHVTSAAENNLTVD